MKGVWKRYFEQQGVNDLYRKAAFGQATDDQDHAGSLVLTDGRIVLLPVRSFYGTFAYTTSPLVLTRLRNDMEAVGLGNIPAVSAAVDENQGLVTHDSVLTEKGKVFLEDLDFSAKTAQESATWADFLGEQIFGGQETMKAVFKRRFAIVSNSSFDFLSETGTEVNARVRIEDDQKTVANGALWYEESLPTETVLAGIAWCDRVYSTKDINRDQILDTFCSQPITCQIGGKATVGKGRVRCLFTGKGA